MSGHISPKSTYYAIFGALMVLTALTVDRRVRQPGLAELPGGASAIAIIKATLVILFFMHVKYSSQLTKMVVGIAFFFLGILLTLTLTDYLSRGWFTSPRGSTAAGAITSLTGPLTTGARSLEETSRHRTAPAPSTSGSTTSRPGPGLGYPRTNEDQEKWQGGWELNKRGRLNLKAGGRFKKLLTIFSNPKLRRSASTTSRGPTTTPPSPTRRLRSTPRWRGRSR